MDGSSDLSRIYTCLKYQGKTPFIYRYTLKKMKERKIKLDLSRRGHQWEEGQHKERRKEDEYGESILYFILAKRLTSEGGCLLYSCMKNRTYSCMQ
jgi:hypothetical protein